MANGSQKGYNGTPKAKNRRVNVISRLEAQLKTDKMLTDDSTARINKELETLKTRI
jgi:hypothetical protein